MDPEREERANDGCARLIDPRTVTTSSRGRVRVVRSPLNVMARLAKVAREFGDFWLKSGRVVAGKPGGFPTISAGFGLGTSWTSEWEWAGA
ncbi:hypothetical protein CRG98_030860 [Punica granatum]|uniref:Uncharacterized protein n=1 Tax=Punica granatum TaxID=22663 RepID=A0A2I0IZA5_PUNGR|nr:hypothetical protein CRG98_030860 [Punica granatum]